MIALVFHFLARHPRLIVKIVFKIFLEAWFTRTAI